MKYRLGIDMGSTSLGWCAVKLDNNNQPCDIIDMGVRIFPDGRDAKSKQPLSVTRREKRSARRRRDRYIERRNKLLNALIKYGLMPKDKTQRKNIELIDPWKARADSAKKQVPLFELGRALFHINQRRGFKSNRILDDTSDSELTGMKGGIQDLQEKLNGQTAGQFLYEKHKNKETVRLRPNTVKGKNEWDFYISREMMEHEVKTILTYQAKFYPEILTSEIQQELTEIIIEQRPLKIPEPGWCTLIEGEKRGRQGYPDIQKFRIFQEVANLQLKKYTHDDPELTKQQKDIILKELTTNFAEVNKNGLLTWAKIKKLANLNRASSFNLEELGRKGLSCDLTSFRLSDDTAFGAEWFELDLATQNQVVDKIVTVANKNDLKSWLSDNFDLSDSKLKAIGSAKLPQGYASISLKAAEKINPHMKSGLTYDKACKKEGIDHSQFHTGEVYNDGDLPYYGQLLQRYVLGGDRSLGKDATPEEYYGKINNPTVHIALNQLKTVVNALIKQLGSAPEEIHLELARELPLGAEQYSKLERDLRKGRDDNERINEELEKLGVVQNYQNRMKYKLWEDLAESPNERCCPFTGDIISSHDIFNSVYEVEHLLPFSLSYDDSRANKVLSHRDANRLKGNQSPYEAFGHSPEGYSWDEIIARVENFANKSKRWRFEPNAWDKWKGENGDLLARMLNDTRYMTRVAREYMTYACHKDKVVAVTGQLTSMLRHHWGLNSLISEDDRKDRSDHRHHAIDALVVACTSRNTLNKVSKASKRAHDTSKLLEKLEYPFQGFERPKIQDLVDDIVISYKPDHGKPNGSTTIGSLHEETYYGRISDGRKKNTGIYATRKPFLNIENKEKKVLEVANRTIRDDLLEKLSTKPTNKQWQDFLAQYAKKHNVRRVRVHIEKSDDVMIPVKDKTGKPYRYVQGGNNYCADIWCTDKGKKAGKWQSEIISMFDAHQPDFTPQWRKDNPTAWRVMRLQINDMVAFENDGIKEIRRVKKIRTDGRVYLRNHLIAKEEGDKLSIGAPASTLQKMNARKIYVDPLGKVKDPGHARKAHKIKKE